MDTRGAAVANCDDKSFLSTPESPERIFLNGDFLFINNGGITPMQKGLK